MGASLYKKLGNVAVALEIRVVQKISENSCLEGRNCFLTEGVGGLTVAPSGMYSHEVDPETDMKLKDELQVSGDEGKDA